MMEEVRLSSRGLVMCLVVVLLAAAAAAAGGIQAEEEKTEEVVITLDSSNFTDTVSKRDFILAEFYAPWYAPSLHVYMLTLYSPTCG